MIYHCPKCHKNIIVKQDFSKINISGGGSIQIKCADIKCTGIVKIKHQTKEEIVKRVQQEWMEGSEMTMKELES